MHLSVPNVMMVLLWAAAGCIAMWVVTIPLRRQSLGGVLASVALCGSAATVGAVLGGVRVMLVPAHEQATLLTTAGIASALGAIVAAAAGQRITEDRRAISAAVADLGAGRVPAGDGRRLNAELESLRKELRDTAERLDAARTRERALESSRRELVAWVSHDLRTPLAGLRAMSEALEDGVVDNPGQYYTQIKASVDRLSTMVNDLFDLSRIQAGAFARDVDAIPVDDLVSDCIAALEPLAAAQGVRLTGTLAATAVVSGNGVELNRALTNVVANAIRHTPFDGRVEVVVGISDTALDSWPHAEVVVHDECGGISDHDMARVFDVGFRGEPARTPRAARPAGAGLGLAITRGIVEAHTGTVHVANTDTGCRFVINLPLAS